MKNVIIGTAGHVDHGKTLLIKALTGIDTDRLAEEKKRGITIELGFAYLDFPDGLRAGVVDVPGHEKFIKNMLAGAGGIDLGLLVVAANEGVMPQTREHLGILSLLDIKDGMIAVTKKDLVDEDWLEMVYEDIAKAVEGTFLQGKPVQAVSAVTGDGLTELKAQLHALVASAAGKNLQIPFRLPVDRVFPVEGFGTVVTGTLIEGCIQNGEVAEILPGGQQAKVRNLQVHGSDVKTAFAGQRVAVNLAGVKKGEIKRGDIIAKPDSVRCSRMLDVRLRALPSTERIILNGSQVHLYHGSRVLLAKVVLLDRDELLPGASCYAQLRLTEPLPAKAGDHFVIRFYSPLATIGGGVILDESAVKHRRHEEKTVRALEIKESGSLEQRLLQFVLEQGAALPVEEVLRKAFSGEAAQVGEALSALLQSGALIQLLPGRYIAEEFLSTLWQSCEHTLARYHRENPLHSGMKVPALRQKLLPHVELNISDAILQYFVQQGKLRLTPALAALSSFSVRMSERQLAIRGQILETYRKAGLETPGIDEVVALFASSERGDAKMVLESLVDEGVLVLLTPQLCLEKEVFRGVCQKTADFFQSHGQLTLAEFRDLLGTSRKYALAILEYYDRNHITKKEGDFRFLEKKGELLLFDTF